MVAPVRVAVFGYLSLDELRLNGNIKHDVTGGGALYAAAGVLAAGGVPSVYASVGRDYPASILDRLRGAGAVLGRCVANDAPARRARLYYRAVDPDQRRSPHHQEDGWWRLTHQHLPPLPGVKDGTAACVLCPMPLSRVKDIIDSGNVAGLTVLDSSEAYLTTDNARAEFFCLAEQVALVALSTAETQLLYPGLSDELALLRLAECATAGAVQKRGGRGLAYADRFGNRYDQPAIALTVVDPTGAGDAVCGALALGLALGLAPGELLRRASEIGARAVSGLGIDGLLPC